MLVKLLSLSLMVLVISCTTTEKNNQEPISDTVANVNEQVQTEDASLTEDDLLGEDLESSAAVADQSEMQEEFGDEDFEEGFDDFAAEDEFAAADGDASGEAFVAEDGDFFADDPAGEEDFFANEEASQEAPLVSEEEWSTSQVDDFTAQPAEEFAGAEAFNETDSDFSAPGAAASAVTTGEAVDITGLDFLANENGGTIVITANAPTSFTTRKNSETNQFIVEVPNANLPEKLKRPYNTTEFQGAVGMFQAYQDPGSDTARFVVQLSEDQEPLVESEGNNIMIVASNLQEGGADMMADTQSVDDTFQEPAPSFEPAVDVDAVMADQNILKEKSLEDFLSGNTKFYGRKINIEVKDWDVRDVFDFLAEQSGLNIVLSEDVSGKITLKLRDVPWDQALHVVLQAKQLGYKRQGSIVRIAPLASLRAESDTAKRVIDSQRLLQPTQVKILPVNYAKASDLEAQVKEFLTPNRGKVKSDKRTNSLVITDIPEVIQKVSSLVESLDTQTPQVLIEAKIIEARESFTRKIGVNWGAGSQVQGTTGNVGAGISAAIDDAVGSLSFGSVGSDFAAVFSLLEEEDVVKVLSSPRILGLNNQTSRIQQTNEIPITEVNVTGDTETRTITYIPLNLTLEVTPQVTAEGSIIMSLDLTREFAGEEEDGNRPLFKRNAKTNIIVNNGETAVIGGVYQNDQSQIDSGVPLLSKIPILGYLFKSETKSTRKNELMMFITPRVINMDKAFANDTTEEELIEEQDDFL